jgi:GT2 family glycosyltransferase
MAKIRDDLKPQATRVAAVITTYNRREIVQRLIRSLATETPVSVILVVDNYRDKELKPLVENLDPRVRYVDPGIDLGRGGGLALGFNEALKDGAITHLWIWDDDAVIVEGCTAELLAAMEREKAELSTPLLAGATGKIDQFPGPLKGKAWQEIRKPITPEQFIAACGDSPLEFIWAPAVCVLVSRRAVEELGLPRNDFWLTGEDLEYTCRLTKRFKGILVPPARALHLQPQSKPADTTAHERYNFIKFCAHLTNLSYISFHLAHGRRMLRRLPSNYFRFMRAYGWTFSTLRHAFMCFSWGAIRRMPAGSSQFQKFKAAYMQAG